MNCCIICVGSAALAFCGGGPLSESEEESESELLELELDSSLLFSSSALGELFDELELEDEDELGLSLLFPSSSMMEESGSGDLIEISCWLLIDGDVVSVEAADLLLLSELGTKIPYCWT